MSPPPEGAVARGYAAARRGNVRHAEEQKSGRSVLRSLGASSGGRVDAALDPEAFDEEATLGQRSGARILRLSRPFAFARQGGAGKLSLSLQPSAFSLDSHTSFFAL